MQIYIATSGESQVKEFDKVAFAHGYQSKPNMPTFEGQEEFVGIIIHSEQYRKPDEFKDKTVVIVGMANTAADIATDLVPRASKVYVLHRRGAAVTSCWKN
jgi:dimethylaniline monooxygenase (N-oxide forming)